MNYYERIQKSIDYIEANLENEIDLNKACGEAYMSLSNYYRMFFALVGYTVKEYVRHRRISHAAEELLLSKITIIDLAVKYGFESQDSFSRAFKRITGFLPGQFRKSKKIFSFERMDIMDKYFEIQDKKLLKKYPDIKVLKELEPLKVAYCNYFGEDPEINAFNIMKEWIGKSGLNIVDQNLRIYGYNNPNPSSPDQKEYGYEVCVTIGDASIKETDMVKTKILEGGLYAVTGVKRNNEDIGMEIALAWKRFQDWLKDSKYAYGGHQWLEEHLGFDEEFNHIGGIDLYMPIVEKGNIDTEKSFVDVKPMYVAVYTAKGKNAIDEARRYMLDWANKERLFDDENEHRFFAYYDHNKIGHTDFWFKMHVTVDKDFKTEDKNICFEEFRGGYYAVMSSKFKYNGWCWGEFMKWINNSKEYTLGDFWFFEGYKINKPEIDMETEMELYMPIKLRNSITT